MSTSLSRTAVLAVALALPLGGAEFRLSKPTLNEAGLFSFSFSSVPGERYDIEYSDPPLVPWSALANLVAASDSMVFSEPATTLAKRRYRVSHAGVTSVNSVGFERVVVPVCSGQPFTNCPLVRPLLATASDRLSQVISAVPEMTKLSKWDPVSSSYVTSAYESMLFGGWDPDFALAPGETFYIYRPFAPFTLTFVGEAVEGPGGVAPTIVNHPQSRTNLAGATATFSVSAAGTEPLIYQWRRNGTNLANLGNVSGTTTATLTLQDVQPDDAGSYRVVVTNAFGSIPSDLATLTVTVCVPPLITAQPAGASKCEGEPVTFSVTATGSDLAYQWRKGSVNIEGATASSHAIAAVAPADAGSYDCVVSGTCGEPAISQAAVLIVTQPAPSLVASPSPLSVAMLRGTQVLTSLELRNTGTLPATDIEVLLPAAPWLGLVTPSRIATLAPDEVVTVCLSLRPASDLPLGPYPGSLVFRARETNLTVPFTFTAVSSLQGHLRVEVVDEFTFHAAGSPKVTNATVTVSDPVTHAIIARAVTDGSGLVLFTDLTEAYYDVEVHAAKHGGFRTTFLVAAEQTNRLSAFLPRQMVSYNWVVRPTEIPDHYRFELRTTFETEVPVPVVTVGPAINLCDLGHGPATVNLQIANHGLIAARNARLHFDANPVWELTPQVTELGDLSARTNFTVPVMVRRLAGASGPPDIAAWLDWSLPTEVGTRYYREPIFVYGANPADCSAGGGVPGLPAGGWSGGSSIGGGGPGGSSALPFVTMPSYTLTTNDMITVRVGLMTEQRAWMSRAAFDATLELVNEAGSDLSNLAVTLDIRDAAGQPAEDRFGIRPPYLDGLSAVDGLGVLANGASGRATWIFIPATNAAPTSATPYTVGGTVTYSQDGLQVTLPLFPLPIQVRPDPRLVVDYFQERDVFSDDPFTLPVEPAVPFALGLRLMNEGYGTARAVHLTSAQPQIVDNASGLLIDFKLIGAQLGGRPVTTSLTLDLGDIAPQQSAVAVWWMTASLQGRFVSYTSIFQHVDDLGNKNLSLVDRVAIHETIHVVRAEVPQDDGLPDFLVNDDRDPDVLADALYLSEGTVAAVTTVADASVNAAPTPADPDVQITATIPPGWVYLRIPDPADASFALSRVHRSDGRDLRLGDNVWRTHRIVHRSGQPDRVEHLLHLLDFDSPGLYTLTYGIVAVPPSITLQPQSRTNAAGTTATFTVSATGTAPLSCQWLKDGTALSDDARMVGATTDTLSLADVRATDAGDYRVVVTNAAGGATSEVAALMIQTFTPGTLRWKFQAGKDVRSSPAIGADGTVYVGCDNFKVYALDGGTGAKHWEFDTESIVYASAAIGADGTVYIGCDRGRLFALDGATGAKRWEFVTGGIQSTPALGADGTVYLGSRDHKLYALVSATGAKRWEFETGGGIQSSPAIGADGTVYVGSDDSKIYALDGATGAKRWEFVTGNWVQASPGIGADGTVYVGSWDWKVYAVNGQTGVKRWEYLTGGDLIYSSPAIGGDGTVYVGSTDGIMHALDGATGIQLGEFAAMGRIHSSPAIGADGTLYVGSEDGRIHALNVATGTQLWEYRTGGGHSSPAIAADGTLYVGGNEGWVYAFHTGNAGGLVQSSWPMFRQNLQHTGRVGTASPLAPSITLQPQSRTNVAGTAATFTVIATGAAPLSYRWLKDGTALENEARVVGAATDTLSLADVRATDAGDYRVVVSNTVGSVTSEGAALIIQTVTPGTLRWRFTTGGMIDAAVTLSLDGTLYVGSYDNQLYALNSATGAELWQAATGGGVSSTPALGANGLVYVAPWDGKLYAFDAVTGLKRWEFTSGSYMRTSPAIGADGTVYVGSGDQKVYALNGDTGAQRWEFATFGSVQSSPAMGADGTVYVGSYDNHVYALNGATGAKRWEFVAAGGVHSSPAIGNNGTLYVGSHDGKVYALEGATGLKRWEFTTGGEVLSSPTVGPDGCVYVGSEDGKVYALEGATGLARWAFATGGKIHLSSPALGSDGTVYIGSWDGKVYALDGMTGSKLWDFVTGGSVVSPPTLGPDGTVYAGSKDGQLYAIHSGSSGGPATSPWPMFHQNVRHTGRLESTQPSLPIVLAQPTLTAEGWLQFIAEGFPGQVLEIQESFDLGTWTPLTTLTNDSGHSVITDPATPGARRFYRARRLP